MTPFIGTGTIRIEVTVSRARTRSVAVKANRPQGLTRMFLDRRPEEAPALAQKLFSLCGFAQSVAARLAVLEAADLTMNDEDRMGACAGLLAERIFETLRALIVHWPTPLPAAVAAAAGANLRGALTASKAIVEEVKAERLDRARVAVTAEQLSVAATALGIPGQGDTLMAGTALAAMLRDVENDRTITGRSPDPLTIKDDPEVATRLWDEPGYANLPYLFGRVAETGAYARFASAGFAGASHLAQRLLARTGDVHISLSQLTALAWTGEFDWTLLASSGPTPGAGGYGAVECARGRLYHQAEIGDDGRLSAYRIIAPTEWNFHPAGPFVETLLSSPLRTDEASVRSVSRLAALFDPCVAFEVDVREAANA
ncbi:hydrogenase assembly protein HupF [Mesorhizobium loti]|uniref:Hydrogenase assembly protein HupF n=1 Tax=Rhizobium loti TaxID=381 RepID=A0A117N447_RHILI|nr:hydrogenase assembly protein HupF [Mesorhizobium loti]